jgi:hypothetical protein
VATDTDTAKVGTTKETGEDMAATVDGKGDMEDMEEEVMVVEDAEVDTVEDVEVDVANPLF